MYDSYNYPPGVDNEMAPWNQPAIPEKDFEITCSQSISRTSTVTTNDYIPGASGVDYEPDGEGGYYTSSWHDEDDFSNTNWSKEYDSNGHYTPIQIIQRCEMLCQFLLERDMTKYGKNSIKKLLEECQGWVDDETEYILEN